MPRTHVHRCPPRAGTDPIVDAAAAARIVSLAIHRPLRHETIALLLDAERRGVAVVAVTGTVDPDAAVEVIELLTSPQVCDGRVAAVVLASVRPAESDPSDPDGEHDDVERDDVERWMELSDIAESQGAELLEWFVVGADRLSCPRDRLGEPPRW